MLRGLRKTLTYQHLGNVIASYYLGSMLTNAGISDVNTQLQIVSFVSALGNLWLIIQEHHSQRLVSRLLPRWNILLRAYWPALDRDYLYLCAHRLHLYDWRTD